jgi:hypothetical protein
VILLVAIAGGLLFGWGWARWHHRHYQAPDLRSTWLVLVGFIPQLLFAYLSPLEYVVPKWLSAVSLSASLIVFLVFVWVNRRLPGMPVLLAGLLLNLSVMAANGGWMPISPEVASRISGEDVLQYMALGSRFGQKDVLLPYQDTHLGYLSDRFLLPAWFPYQVAFSAGDILIAIGACWLLAEPSAKNNQPKRSEK